jgi:tellurite resistance protein TerC
MPDESKPSKAQQLVDGIADRRERHRERSRVYRIAVVAAGVVVLLAGLAMTVLPGPAFVVIPIGLSLLALEFVWAEAVLEKLAKGADFALSRRPPRSALIAAALVLVLGVAAFLVIDAA